MMRMIRKETTCHRSNRGAMLYSNTDWMLVNIQIIGDVCHFYWEKPEISSVYKDHSGLYDTRNPNNR